MTRTRKETGVHAALALAVFGVGYLLSVVIHEGLHFLINFAQTGQIRACGLGPFTIIKGRFATCLVNGGTPGLNVLLTPLLTAGVAVAAMYFSHRIDNRGVKWGVFTIGAWKAITESLYGAGWLIPPHVTAESVKYWGDGRQALEAFGWVAQIPGWLMIFVALYVMHRRLEYEDA